VLIKKKQVIDYCLTFENIYEDYLFHDQNWCVIRHVGNDKIFAWIFEKDSHVWVNVKCDSECILFWRNAFDSVIPAYP
jgi:predicted DNA-binding protein (MmcQ/YjbR family)